MPSVHRILDANANRAREALRVMEEAARFSLNDAVLAGDVKSLRHDLATVLDGIPVGMLSANRDTPGDVGTTIKAEGEMQRSSLAEVVIAGGKRLSEALRVMEEYAKVSGESAPGLASGLESLRYRGYVIEQRLERALASGNPKRGWRLCVLITQSLCVHGHWLEVAKAVIDGGADCIQLREKTLDAGELLTRTRALASLCRPAGVCLIVNDRPDVALLGGADGVHVGQSDLPVSEVRKLVGRQLIVGVSTSQIDQVHQAYRDGADYVGLGPMFATTTKAKDRLAGPEYLKQYQETFAGQPRWALAIGGITPQTLPILVQAGLGCREGATGRRRQGSEIDGIGEIEGVGGVGGAVSSSVCSASDPRRVVERMLGMMQADR